MAQPHKTKGLSRQLLWRVILLSLLLTILISSVHAWVTYQDGMSSIQKTMEQIKETQAKSIGKALWDFNHAQLKTLLEGLMNFPFVKHVSVNDEGILYFEAGTKIEEGVAAWDIPLLHSTSTGPVWFGNLRLLVDIASIRQTVIKNILQNLLLMTMMVALITVLLFLLFEGMVTRHLTTIGMYFRKSDSLQSGLPLILDKQRRNDELDILVDAYNTLSAERENAYLAMLVAQEKTKASEERYRGIVETALEGIWVLDKEHTTTYCNRRMGELLGYEPEELLGRSLSDFIPPEQLPDHVEKMETRKLGQDEIYERSFCPRDGGVLWTIVSARAIVDEQGKFCGSFGMITDITERKRAEEQLMQTNRDLEESLFRVEELAVQSQIANRAKSEFLANMSHEVRTPLNGVVGMLQLLQHSQLNETQNKYACAAIKASKRLTRLLTDILDLSRIEAGRMEIVHTAFEAKCLKESIQELLSLAAQNKDLQLEFYLDESLPATLIGDEARLLQILFNLVGNAIKFTEQGVVRVETTLLPSADNAHVRVLFTVSDTGIGIPDKLLNDIFAPFFQAESSYTRRFQGAGLGLSIVRKLVELLGGELAIDNSEGHGTTMYLSLPFELPIPSRVSAEQVAAVAPPCTGKSLRILLVEDDDFNLQTGKLMLEQLGYTVTTAKDGKEAFQRLTEQELDLILMDIQMPIMDGVEATKAIRGATTLGEKSKIPIVAMTAYAMTGDKEKFLAAGMDGYIAKPVDMDQLKEIIKKMTERKTFSAGASTSVKDRGPLSSH